MNLLEKSYYGGNKMEVKFSVTAESNSFTSQKIAIGGLVLCQFKAEATKTFISSSKTEWNISFYEWYDRVDNCESIRYKISSKLSCNDNYTSDSFEYISKDSIVLTTDFTQWHYKGTKVLNQQVSEYNLKFDVHIEEIILGPSQFNNIHEDTALTDFELCAEDGSINAHKAVLAASSSMLNTMLAGEWKETEKGKLELAGVTKGTLTDLVNYIYLKVLPKPDGTSDDNQTTRLEELLKLASFLMMSDLVRACSAQLLLDLTTDNAFELMSFAMTWKLKALMKGILLSLKHESVDLINDKRFPGDWIH